MGKALDTEPEDLSPLSKNFHLYGHLFFLYSR